MGSARMTANTAAESALRIQAKLDRAVDHYISLDEVEMARRNVLEVLRLNPESAKSALCQMMLCALRSRQKVLERGGAA